MFLKKIYISGFKSFPDPLELDLREGMTAIVGPNGCGKTNISDAVRWCLGEQSAKNLRGAQMADVIFSGSDERKPVGMAEVSLLISNESRSLDLPYDEIQITRRLFRSGESAYLINRKPCRLKDITTLLTDTGLGAKAYSLIEKTQVDQILSGDPKERRSIFDEAAGIGRYKRNRAEALAKLEDVEAQQLLLAERLDEISGQLRTLMREVRKVEHHQRLGEEIRLRQGWMSRHHWELRQVRRRELEASSEALRDRLLDADAALEVIDAEHVESRQRLDDATERLRGIEESRYRSLERVKDYENRLNLNQDRRRTRQERKDVLESERREAESRLGELAAERERLEGEAGELQRRHDEARAALARDEEELEARRAEFETLDLRVKELGVRLMELRAAVTDRERLRAERTARRKARLEEQARLEEEEAGLARRRTELAAELEEAKEAHARLEGRLEKLEERRAEAAELQQRANREIEEAARETREALHRLTECRSRFDSLHSLYSRQEGYRKPVAVVLAAADKGSLTGIHGAVAQLIGTEKRYEAALEAALGAGAQALVCDDENDAARAIELLKRLRVGRARFLPLRLIRPRQPVLCAATVDSPGLIGDALGLVEYEERFAAAVEYTLGGTLVVEGLSEATRLLRDWRDRARFRRIVTLEGELVESSGAVSGGGGHDGGLLSRERELDQLRENLARLEGDYETVTAREKKRRDEFQAVGDSLNALQRELTEERLERERSAARLESRRSEMATTAEREADVSRRLAALRSELEPVTAEPEEAGETDEAALREEHDEKLGARDLLQARLDKAREAITERRLELSGLENELKLNRREIDRLGQETPAVEAGLRKRRDELERLREEEAEADRETEELNAGLLRLSLGRDDEDKSLTKLRQEQDELNTAVGELLERRADALRGRDGLRDELSGYELELRAVESEQNRLADEIRERAGVDLEEVELPADFDLEAAHAEIDKLEKRRRRLGDINFHAQRSFDDAVERRDFIRLRREELTQSAQSLKATIRRLNQRASESFLETFNLVSAHFEKTFGELFGGGEARLSLTEDDPLESGVMIFVRPPGKGVQELISRSTGERSMTAIALLFALFTVKPSPFCVLDEIDAPLDDANVERYLRLLRRHLADSQFLAITHNRRTMEAADTLVGVTMEEPGVSRVYSLAFSGGRLVTEEDQRSFSLEPRPRKS